MILISREERYETRTAYELSIAIKAAGGQFLNTVVVLLLVNYFRNENEFADSSGLIENIWSLMIVNIFVPPLMRLIDPGFLINMIIFHVCKLMPNYFPKT